MELAISTVLKEVNNENAPLFRIIDMDDKFVHCIDLTPPHKMPNIRRRSDIQELVDNGFLIFADDPFYKVRAEEEIKERDKVFRDKKLPFVLFVFDKNRERFLIKSHRKALFEETAKRFNVNEVMVRRDVSRYLQHGMNSNALLPCYDNIGGKGKNKPDIEKKRGRQREKYKQGIEGPGINVTGEIMKQIETVMRFYRNLSQPSLPEAYAEFLKRYYSEIYYENGKPIAKVWGTDRIITYRQFSYHAKKLLAVNKSTTIIKRLGQNEYNKNYDSLIGDITKEAFGPGSKFQIDATHVNVFCVSSENRDCYVGTPTYYSINDVMSRYIPGIYIGLENPSWIGAAMAINNLVEDKVDYCARFGIDITPEMWPTSLLPEKFLADNAEFAGDMPLPLTANLGIEIENAPSYRGDCKGIVENSFGIMKKSLRSLPGASIKKMIERGDIDVRHDAIMTVDEVTRVIIREVISHNTTVMKNYDKGIFAIREPIRLTPLDIWNWGIKNRSCGFKFRNSNMVKLATMPRATARITREGIAFKKRHYSCKAAIEEEWFVNPSRTSITIAHDPRTMQYIYIPAQDGRNFITCTLLDKHSFYENMHYDDYTALSKYNMNEKSALEHEKWQKRVDDNLAKTQDIKEAKKQKKAQGPSSISKTAKQRGLKENRVKERDKRRNDEAFILNNEEITPDSKLLPFKQQEAGISEGKEFENRLYDYLDTLGDYRDDK